VRRVRFDPNSLGAADRSWYEQWVKGAASDQAQLRRDVENGASFPLDFKPDRWSALKRWLLQHVFFGKCGYCESALSAHSFGAADHYRPKGRVTVKAPNGMLTVVSAGSSNHRGYYWLAYQPLNVVPCCDRCNTATGKRDQFPVDGQRVFDHREMHDPSDVGELNNVERPLLLNPYSDEPGEHLRFGELGAIAAYAGSRRGQATIDICELSRESLCEQRSITQEQVVLALGDAIFSWTRGLKSLDDALLAVRAKFTGETSAYSESARQTLEAYLRVLESQRSSAVT
jgi:hypothetical protein